MKNLDRELLRGIEFFSAFPEKKLDRILAAEENGIEEYAPKDIIFQEGDIGSDLFIMLDGLAEVYVRGEQNYRDISIASLKPGDLFGKQAATSKDEIRRSATIKVVLPSRVFRINKQYVLDAIQSTAKPVIHESTRSKLHDVLAKIPIFHGLTEDECANIDDWATLAIYKKGNNIYKPDEDAEYLFIVLEGSVEIYIVNFGDEKHTVNQIQPGQYFGEIELLPGGNGKRYQFSVALVDTRIMKIEKKIFDSLLARNSKLATYIKQMHQLKKINAFYTSTKL